MPLNLDAIDSVVRITSAGDLEGTGFLVSVPSESVPGRSWAHVVTAHHVVDNAIEIALRAPNPFTNGTLYEPDPVSNWWQPLPGVDLAIACFEGDPEKRYSAYPIERAIPTETVEAPMLGQATYYIGIFEPLMRPVVRSGTIAAIDQEDLPNARYSYTAHLMDCRSYNGFSGSPCMVEFPLAGLDELTERPYPVGGERASQRLGRIAYYSMLCGMFTRHYTDEDEPDAHGAVSRYGMGVLVRSHEIKEALMTPRAREERRKLDERLTARKKAKQPPLRDAGASASEDEFARFEDLTRHLVQVPKKELDEQREQGNGD